MTNGVFTAPKKSKPVLAAICCALGALSLCMECAFPFIVNLLPPVFGNNINMGIDIVLAFLTAVAVLATLIAAVALFMGKQGALLYVPIFVVGGIYCARYYQNVMTLMDHLGYVIENGSFKDLVSRFMDYGFLASGNMFAGLAFIVFGVWLILASKGKLKKLWMLTVLPFALSCFFLMLDSAYLLYWLIINPGQDPSYTQIMTYSFISAVIGCASVLLFTLCDFFTCLNIKKNS